MAERLIQTRVPEELAKLIANAAKLEGDTTAGWVRRLLFRHFGAALVEAWTRPAGSVPPDDGVRERCQPQFLLRPVRDISASDRVFALHEHAGGQLTPAMLRDRPTLLAAGRWIILRGSPVPWEVVTQYALGSTVEVTLRPVQPAP